MDGFWRTDSLSATCLAVCPRFLADRSSVRRLSCICPHYTLPDQVAIERWPELTHKESVTPVGPMGGVLPESKCRVVKATTMSGDVDTPVMAVTPGAVIRDWQGQGIQTGEVTHMWPKCILGGAGTGDFSEVVLNLPIRVHVKEHTETDKKGMVRVYPAFDSIFGAVVSTKEKANTKSKGKGRYLLRGVGGRWTHYLYQCASDFSTIGGEAVGEEARADLARHLALAGDNFLARQLRAKEKVEVDVEDEDEGVMYGGRGGGKQAEEEEQGPGGHPGP